MPADLNTIRGEYLELVRTGRRDEALELVLAPLGHGELDLATFYDEVLAPVAARIGDLWHAGAITVADEHAATAVNREARLRARALADARPPVGRTALLACAPEEQHDLGLQMAADVLDAEGWETHVLGARTPSRDLALYAERLEPDVVVIACSTPLTITGLIASVTLVHDRGIPAVVGGRAVRDYPAVADAAGADAACSLTSEVAATIERVVVSASARRSG